MTKTSLLGLDMTFLKAAAVGLLSVAIAGCSANNAASQLTDTEANMSNKQKVTALLNSIESGDTSAIAYINPSQYTQHNLAVEDGLAGFGKVLHQLPEGSAKVDVKRVFEDGDYVFTHTDYNFFGPKVGFDIFRFEDGVIVEHWDNLQATAATTVSGRTQVDGPTEVTDLDKTAANKAVVKGLLDDVMFGANPQKITDYISVSQYDQHNPAVADGLDALGKALAAMAEAGTPMVYTANHVIVGEGNFVLSVSEGQFLNEHVAFYDLFRLEDGKIVEHWDTIEAIPEQSQWQNSNGKFGFK